MKEVTIKATRCTQCGHNWVPRKAKIFKCPRCQSVRWNEPKREAVSR